jgi:hypothetical protein
LGARRQNRPLIGGSSSGNRFKNAKRTDAMEELMRTNDPVLVSFVKSLLEQSGCQVFVADENMSVMEGSIGAFPRRVLVAEQDYEEGRRILVEAELGEWLVPRKR